MKLFQRKKSKPSPVVYIQPLTDEPIDLFQKVGETCRYCQNGPIVKYEPEQFKVQCLSCLRVTDKVDQYLGGVVSTPETKWIDDRLNKHGLSRAELNRSLRR